MSRTISTPNRPAELVHTIYDPIGTALAEYIYFPNLRLIYVRWHGHFTSDEVIRVAKDGLRVHERWQPMGMVYDTRGTSGDWGDAATFLMYEWIPAIKASSKRMRAIAYVLSPDTLVTYDNAQMLAEMNRHFAFRTFYTPRAAWRWLRHITMA